MCGIFGWVTPGRSIDKNKGVNSVKMLRHRGPDDEGYLFVDLFRAAATPANGDDSSVELSHSSWRGLPNSDSADLMLGFRRLSIQDLSSAGHQPMCTKDGKLWIVFTDSFH